MLEVTSAAQEALLGVDFTDIYKNSELFRSDHLTFPLFIKKIKIKNKNRRGWKNERELYGPCLYFELKTAIIGNVFKEKQVKLHKNLSFSDAHNVTRLLTIFSELFRRNKALIKELSSPPPGSNDLYFPTQYSHSFFIQCMACLWKQHWSYWRNPPYTAVRLLFTTFIALMFGTIFWDMGSKRYIEVQHILYTRAKHPPAPSSFAL